jgi:hypothetical protein
MQEPKMSKERVRVIIVTYLRSLVTPDLEEVRKLELERLDELQTAHWPKATNGDVFATQQVLAIMTKRAALLGLNAPQKVQTEEIGELADAKATLLAKLNKMAERMKQVPAPVAEPLVIEHEPPVTDEKPDN